MRIEIVTGKNLTVATERVNKFLIDLSDDEKVRKIETISFPLYIAYIVQIEEVTE